MTNALDIASIVERLTTNLRNKAGDMGDQVTSHPAADYVDPATYQAEQARIFRQLPMVVGHGSQLPNPGDFITVNCAGPPLLIVRGKTGALQAFINACRHRGAQIETAACGHRESLVCPYHGWNYSLSGELLNITERQSFPGLDPTTLGLIELPVCEQQGLIFVRTTPGTIHTLDHNLRELDAHFAAIDLKHHQHFRTEIIHTQFNWKIGVEGSLETYHFRYLHANTAARLFASMATIYDYYPPHQRQGVAKASLLKRTIGADDLTAFRDQVLLTYFIFPNMLVSITNDHVLLTAFYPRGVDGCAMIYTLLTPTQEATAERTAHWEKTWALTRSVLGEDFAVQEGVQRGCAANPAALVNFGGYEFGLSRFRAAWQEALNVR
jgi:phenylpropionate dioxygenase-like ring-hydroxylating dioxygenase large terminal subunit